MYISRGVRVRDSVEARGAGAALLGSGGKYVGVTGDGSAGACAAVTN
jgi:hypothetical protein